MLGSSTIVWICWLSSAYVTAVPKEIALVPAVTAPTIALPWALLPSLYAITTLLVLVSRDSLAFSLLPTSTPANTTGVPYVVAPVAVLEI